MSEARPTRGVAGPAGTGERRALVLFVAGVLAVGLLVGAITRPDGWYAALAKPSFNPPPWVFPPAWTLLYVLIGIAGWRVWRARARQALQAWSAQMALNLAWTPVFFGLHHVGAAFAVILALLAALLLFMALAWPRDRVAAWLFVPYALWVAFAATLNGAILVLN